MLSFSYMQASVKCVEKHTSRTKAENATLTNVSHMLVKMNNNVSLVILDILFITEDKL